MMDCATDEIGMAESDIVNTIGILKDMSKFPQLADRLQQGMLDGLYLGRLLDNNDGFVSDPAFRVDDAGPVIGGEPAGDRHLAPVLQRQQPGRDLRRRA